MKKRTLSKLKSLFGSKKGKRQHQQETYTKSRSASPEAERAASPASESYRAVRTPPGARAAGPPPSPPVPTRPVAPHAPEPTGPLVPCPICERTFAPKSLIKHARICEKTSVKKRKTFDSSRQRREGTDLEQFLPKNFGLPENSPFLEKSPPPTAKPTPKPKSQSVRNAIKKPSADLQNCSLKQCDFSCRGQAFLSQIEPSADLQKCPHCNRAFGLRAFERHVEWCADKAKILPAAPAQPPQHIADAKQRLHARTQYKAPLARRRSSQTREKSSNSRSASVESSRGQSPPAPREYGDCKQGRNRLSESSSNDHDDAPAHVPVIRHSRAGGNGPPDAHVRARQARLARDLSSSRGKQDPQSCPVQQSHTNPDLKKSVPPNKQRLNVKKKQQLKKLEEIANKYNEKLKKDKDIKQITDNTSSEKDKTNSEKSQIPVPTSANKGRAKRKTDVNQNNQEKRKDSSQPSTSKMKPAFINQINPNKVIRENIKKPDKKNKIMERAKENSISMDSLEDAQSTNRDKNSQSIGINTELLCVPCVIHETSDAKPSRKKKKAPKDNNIIIYNYNNSDTKVELLYKNPLIRACNMKVNDPEGDVESQDNLDISGLTPSTNTFCNSDKVTNEVVPSSCNLTTTITKMSRSENSADINYAMDDSRLINNDEKSLISQRSNYSSSEARIGDLNNLSAEHFEESYEHDISAELYDDSIETKNDEDNNLECRHGSGDTYTKFSENQADLEEFLNITDKMIVNDNCPDEQDIILEKDLEDFHTPKTNSIEAINKNVVDTEIEGKHSFSDTFDQLKSNLKNLITAGAGDNINDVINSTDDADEARKKVCDMEHITVYGLKFYEKQSDKEKQPKEKDTPDEEIFKLPSISENNKPERQLHCNQKEIKGIFKYNNKHTPLGNKKRTNKEYQTFIINNRTECGGNSDDQSSSEAPPLKLPRIEMKRLDDTYDPFVSAARQMKELMSSESNIPKKIQNSSKDPSRTLPMIRPAKEKSSLPYFRSDNTKSMKDTLNKSYQKTPTLQRMKSFGSSNENHNSSFGSRCSSFRVNRNEKKSSQTKLNTTFTKSSKENISSPTVDKNYFYRNSSLNRSFSSYTASSYSTPKPKDKIPKIATSMYHSFQRTTTKQPVKLEKIKKDEEKKDFVSLDLILADDNSSMTDSNYIDPRLINENDNLPINVNTILNNPDIISSMESLLTTENLPSKFESFSNSNLNNNNNNINKGSAHSLTGLKIVNKIETNNNININNPMAPIVDDLSAQYDKIMSSFEQSIASKDSVRDNDSLCEDFDLEEFMTTFDEEIHKHKTENKRAYSSTTRIVKQSELADSNKTSELNSICSSPKVVNGNGLIPVNKSMSLNFSSNNVVGESLFPSSVKRSTSLLDSIHKKNTPSSGKSRQKVDLLEQDIMQSLKDFDKFYENERCENNSAKEAFSHNGTTKRGVKSERIKSKKHEPVPNGNQTPSGKASTDSAYSSLNRISPSKLSVCTKDAAGLNSLEQIPAGSDSGGSHKDEIRSVSSEEFLAMERSVELDPIPPPTDKMDSHGARAGSRASSRWARAGSGAGALSSSGSEASLAAAPRRPRFCHECGSRFPFDAAKFCIQCGVKRLVV